MTLSELKALNETINDFAGLAQEVAERVWYSHAEYLHEYKGLEKFFGELIVVEGAYSLPLPSKSEIEDTAKEMLARRVRELFQGSGYRVSALREYAITATHEKFTEKFRRQIKKSVIARVEEMYPL